MGRRRLGADEGAMRRCSKCQEWKNRQDNFYKMSHGPMGFYPDCKSCRYKYVLSYIRRNPRLQKSASLQKPLRERLVLIDKQPYCVLCGFVRQSGKPQGRLVVDHCHKTGKVRAVLCYQCNSGLGMFKENPQLLRDAAEYLEFFKKRNGA